MQLFQNLSEWKTVRQSEAFQGKRIGFVPTMGALHQAHEALIEQARKENDVVIVSIYVNPLQFNQQQDFDHYPNRLQDDIGICHAHQVNYLLTPCYQEMYPDDGKITLTERLESHRLEGLARPGHFNGMLTVVIKLLLLTRPTYAYFGEKDYQQHLLVKQMVNSYFLDTQIVRVNTIRDDAQVALSSRLFNLSAKDRQKACEFGRIFHQYDDPEKIKTELNRKNIAVEYIERHDNRLFAAYTIGNTRLIDNRKVL